MFAKSIIDFLQTHNYFSKKTFLRSVGKDFEKVLEDLIKNNMLLQNKNNSLRKSDALKALLNNNISEDAWNIVFYKEINFLTKGDPSGHMSEVGQISFSYNFDPVTAAKFIILLDNANLLSQFIDWYNQLPFNYDPFQPHKPDNFCNHVLKSAQ